MKIKTITYRIIHGNRMYVMKMQKVVGLRLREKVKVSSKKTRQIFRKI